MVTDEQIQAFLARAAEDDAFAAQLEGDPFAALGEAGFGELADEARREEDRLAAIAARIAEDEGFRGRIEDDPASALRDELPEPALEPFLAAIGAPESVVARARTDVEGHIAAGSKASVAAVTVAVLGALAVGQQASAAAYGSVEPNPARYGSVEPNPLRPTIIRWGSQPGGVRWTKAGWQALRLQASRFNG